MRASERYLPRFPRKQRQSTSHTSGVQESELSSLSEEHQVISRIIRLRSNGWTLQSIADQLNALAVPTPGRGIRWHPRTVKNVLHNSDNVRHLECMPDHEAVK